MQLTHQVFRGRSVFLGSHAGKLPSGTEASVVITAWPCDGSVMDFGARNDGDV